MSAIAAPPPWVLALPLDPGAWRVLVGLWTFADFKASAAHAVWPNLAALRSRAGNIKPAALYKQLDKLRDLGWLRDDIDGGYVLAWGSPFVADSPSMQDSSPSGESPSVRDSSPSGDSEVSKCASKSLQVENRSKEDLAVDLARDLAGPRARASDPVDRELDALTDPRLAQHRAIEAEQRALADSKRPRAQPPTPNASPHLDAARRVSDAWAIEADMRGGWAQSMAEVVDLLGLSEAQVTSLLERWDAAWAKLPADERARVDAGGGPLPPRRGVWWGKWASWRADALGQLRPTSASTVIEIPRGAAASYDPVAAASAAATNWERLPC